MNAILQRRREEAGGQTIEEAQNPARSAVRGALCCKFWFKAVIILLIIGLGFLSKSNVEEGCGIDPILFVIVYFAIFLLMAIFEIMIVFMLGCDCSDGTILTYYAVTTLLCVYVLAGWIIYGYT